MKFRTVKIRKWFRWVDFKFEDLKRGHIYKLIDPDGSIVVSGWLVLKDAVVYNGFPKFELLKDKKDSNYMIVTNKFKRWSLKQNFVRYFPKLSAYFGVGLS